MKVRKKPVVVEAYRWFKNGDHPEDDSDGLKEGKVVRRFRDPNINGDDLCMSCGHKMHDHGWIDTPEGGHRVCPGDWIIRGVEGEYYPCKHSVFVKTYEPVGP